MVQGAREEAWDHTCWLSAVLSNIHRDPKKDKPINPLDIHPYRKKADAKVQMTKDQWHAFGDDMKAMFGKKKRPNKTSKVRE